MPVKGAIRRSAQRLEMEGFVHILRTYPSIPILFTIGIGFLLGRISFKGITLGSVTAVLLTGVFVGQLDIPIGPPLKSFFFLVFLFSIGYKCGPKFAGSLNGSGLLQIIFAITVNIICFLTCFVFAKLMHYNAGIATGLYAGSQTTSPVIGIAVETIASLGIDSAQKSSWISLIAVCYAVTYLYGTIGAVWILGTIGPKMLGGLEKVRRQTKELEEQLKFSARGIDPAIASGNQPIVFRAYKTCEATFSEPWTIGKLEARLNEAGTRIFVERLRKNDGTVLESAPELPIDCGDTVVLSSRHEYIVDDKSWIGSEVYDPELMDFPVVQTRVMVTKRAAGLSVAQLREQSYMYGVMIESITGDDGVEIPVLPKVTLHNGDMIALQGLADHVRRAVDGIGVEERPTNQTDMAFLCLAIATGAFIGALSIHLGNVPIGLSTSGGALIAGIFFGWYRTRHPSMGMIPEASLWLMNNLGLNLFIAVIGIESGPSFVSGIRAVGLTLFITGFFATTIPLLIAIIIGDKIFRFHPAINLGCCAGGRKTTPGLGAVTQALDSPVPAIGYTITSAVSNTCSIFLGIAMVLLCI